MLAKIVTDMQKHSNEKRTFLYSCKHGKVMTKIASKDISKTLKNEAKVTDLQKLGFVKDVFAFVAH